MYYERTFLIFYLSYLLTCEVFKVFQWFVFHANIGKLLHTRKM